MMLIIYDFFLSFPQSLHRLPTDTAEISTNICVLIERQSIDFKYIAPPSYQKIHAHINVSIYHPSPFEGETKIAPIFGIEST